jgi:hypothetical protein
MYLLSILTLTNYFELLKIVCILNLILLSPSLNKDFKIIFLNDLLAEVQAKSFRKSENIFVNSRN